MADEAKSETKTQAADTLDIEQAIKSIMGEVDESALEPAINLLLKIVKNILSSKDPKFRTLNLSKPVLQEKIGRFSSCVRFLTVLGFKHDPETRTSKVIEEDEKRLEHACLLMQEALFTLEKEEKAQETEDFRPTEPDYDLSQVRVILQQLSKQIEASVGENNFEQHEAKLSYTLDTLLKINLNLTSSKEKKFRTLDMERTELFVLGWPGALEFLQFLGFVQDQHRLVLEQEHTTKISRACSVLKRFIEEVTPTEEQLMQRQAQQKPPERLVQFFSATAVTNPQLEGSYDRADANLLLQASAAHQKRMKEQFPDVIVTRQRRAEEKAKTKRRYDRTLVRVLFKDINPENQIILQAYFSPYETIDALFTLIQAHLCTSSKAFYFLNPPESIDAPSTIVFDPTSEISSPTSSATSTGGQARHLGSRLLGPPKKKEKKPATFHLAEKKLVPTFAQLRLVPAAALHFHWSDGSVVCNPLLGECYAHRKPLDAPNIPKAINKPEAAKVEEAKGPKEPQEDPRVKKHRLKEAALLRKMGF